MEMYGLESRYYAFDHAGWRFIVLDSVRPAGEGYTTGLDPEQRTWLEQELKKLNSAQPVVIVSHVPILSITALTFDKEHHNGGEHHVPDGWMFADAVPLHYLLREYPNVKLCLSGHLHQLDRCEVDGVTYICGGAVCANWWKGNLQKVDEGYGLVDLYDDGSFDYAYQPYDWQVRPE
jgi:3',5'-cyclic-AMP phosphodiesterase